MKTAALVLLIGIPALLVLGTTAHDRATRAEADLQDRTYRALVGAGLEHRVSVDGRDVSVDGRKALRDSAVAVVERIDGVANVIFRPDDNPARAWWRLDLGTVPISFVATVPSPEMATDVLADLYAVFPEAGVEARVVVEEGASPRGWPSTWVPLFRTLQERAPGARADVASGYLVLSGVTAAGPDDGLVPRLLGAAPGLALEVATDTVE